MVYKYFDKKSASLANKSASSGAVKNERMSNQRLLDLATQELAERVHKPIIRKFEKGEVYSPFIDNIWVTDLADMQLMSRLNKGIRFSLCVIDCF